MFSSRGQSGRIFAIASLPESSGSIDSSKAQHKIKCEGWINGLSYSSDRPVLAVSTSRCIRLFDTSNGALTPTGTVDGRRCVEGRVSKGLDSRRNFVLDDAARPLDGWYVGCSLVIQGERRSVVGYDGDTRVVTLDADLSRAVRSGDSYALEREEAFFQARACAPAFSLLRFPYCRGRDLHGTGRAGWSVAGQGITLTQGARRWDAALRDFVVPPPTAICGSQRPCCRCAAAGVRLCAKRRWGGVGWGGA